jgi:ribosomal protein L37AE/L43A
MMYIDAIINFQQEVVMAINRIQFQPGLSMTEFFRQYGSEKQCEEALEKSRWPDGYKCDRCGHTRTSRFRAKATIYWQCCACRHQTSVRSGTIFHSSKLPLTKWFQAMFLISQSKNNVATLELRRQLGISYAAAWRVKHKLMQVMKEQEDSRKLHGDVVIDDAYLGGERQGKRGRGSENKIPFVAAVQLNEEGHPHFVCFDLVTGFTKDAIGYWARRFLNTSSKVVSDGLQCFSGVSQAGASHYPEIVGNQQRSTDMPCFAWINILLGNLKTSFSGTYHAFKFRKYASRYLAERQYLFNRRFNMKAILPIMLRGCTITGPRPEKWLRSAEL